MSAEEQEETDRVHKMLAKDYESSSEEESSENESRSDTDSEDSAVSQSEDSSEDESIEEQTMLVYKFQVLSAQDLAVAD